MLNGNEYWTHNTAYHNWILSHARGRTRVLDVGCGDGLLVQRLSRVCGEVIGIDLHLPSIKKAKIRLNGIPNISIITSGFEDYEVQPESFDLIVFVASLHHMEHAFCIKKAKNLLSPNGKLLIVGCAKPVSLVDWLIEILRIVPARLGSLFHGEKQGGDIGVPTAGPKASLTDIRELSRAELPGANIRQGLYYRYLLSWTNS